MACFHKEPLKDALLHRFFCVLWCPRFTRALLLHINSPAKASCVRAPLCISSNTPCDQKNIQTNALNQPIILCPEVESINKGLLSTLSVSVYQGCWSEGLRVLVSTMWPMDAHSLAWGPLHNQLPLSTISGCEAQPQLPGGSCLIPPGSAHACQNIPAHQGDSTQWLAPGQQLTWKQSQSVY